MVVPITGFGILGKRLAQVSRRCGAITMPDLFRERFGSAALGLCASLFILFYMSFMMVAQFKAGALIMKISWAGTGNWSEDQNAGRFQLSEAALSRLGGDIPPSAAEALGQHVGHVYADERELADDIRKPLATVKPPLAPQEARRLEAKIASASGLAAWPDIVRL